MASKYSKLPSEILRDATTQDLSIHIHAETQRSRNRAKDNKGDVASTYTQSEILEAYNNIKR